MKRLGLAAALAMVSVLVTVPSASAYTETCNIGVRKVARGDHGWKFSARLVRAGKPYANKAVHLDLELFDDFVDFGPTKRTNDKGRAVWTTSGDIPENDFVFRFRFDGNRKTLNCLSDPFTLPRR